MTRDRLSRDRLTGDRQTRRRALAGLLVLVAVVAPGCQAPQKSAATAPAAASEGPHPVISNLDPGAMRLQDISGALLMYFALHRKLPAQLDDLKPLAEGDAPLNFTSPRSGKPYLYTPNGIILQDLNQRMIVYDPAPGPYGYREAITIDEPIVGQPLVAKVVAVPESFFLLRPPR
ncbi:MAG: hypothetical protein ACTHLZ_02785 [Tepidisphaeraceae bacterium]